MKRLYILVFIVVLAGGCAAPGEKSQWDDFWKDLRGDNMEMRGFSGRDSRDRP
jgi:hypothetical protein